MLRKVLAFAVCTGLAASFAVLAAEAPKSGPAGGEYAGANKCRVCHAKEYKAWLGADTKHAQALETLKATTPDQLEKMNELLKTSVTDPAGDSACVRCHVTGYGQPGGYPASDSLKNAGLSFVGCEDCHGPASRHLTIPMSDKAARKASMVLPAAENCVKCHTPEMSPKFDFATWSQRVHPIAAAAPAK